LLYEQPTSATILAILGDNSSDKSSDNGSDSCSGKSSDNCSEDANDTSNDLDNLFTNIPFAADNLLVLEGKRLLIEWQIANANRRAQVIADDLAREWLRLLVGFGEPIAPPWASYYLAKDPVIFSQKTLAVRQFYERHGLKLARKHQEPDDHLGLMLQFLAIVIRKEALALEAGDSALVVALQEEQAKFLHDYVLPWITLWQDRIATEAKDSFYNGLALLIVGALQDYAARFIVKSST
jgi:TorA maturation chaperone TorD